MLLQQVAEVEDGGFIGNARKVQDGKLAQIVVSYRASSIAGSL